MKKIVIKIGRSIATSKRNKLDEYRFEQLAKQVKILHAHGVRVVLVVSAAVCCGEAELKLKNEYNISKSLVGGVGQAAITAQLYTIFKKHDLAIGQLLVTKHDLEHEQKRQTIQKVIQQAAEQKIVLIMNENDIVELHSFAGNDYLATEIAKLTHAHSLLLLTDVGGILNEEMNIISHYSSNQTLAQITKNNRKDAVGGIKAKVDAALAAAEHGIATWITHGKTKDVLTRMFLHNEHIGTRILGGVL